MSVIAILAQAGRLAGALVRRTRPYLLPIVILGIAPLMVWPWLQPVHVSDPALARYLPVRDGAARTTITHSHDGQVRWTSVNTSILPGPYAMSSVGNSSIPESVRVATVRYDGLQKARESLLELMSSTRTFQLIDERITEVDASGRVSARSDRFLQDASGLRFFGSTFKDRADLLLNPPALAVPARLESGSTWRSAGKLGENIDYVLEGEALVDADLARQSEIDESCIMLTKRWSFTRAGTPTSTEQSRTWLCPDLGEVRFEILQPDGAVGAVTRPRRPDDPAPPRPVADASTTAQQSLTSQNRQFFARAVPSRGRYLRPGFAPVWVPGSPPLILAAAYDGDLLAFDARDRTGNVQWEFRTGATIDAAPAVHPLTGDVYVGSSDKLLRAIDSRGMFRWSFTATDSIVASPTLHQHVVIFAADDGRVRALQQDTGALVWEAEVGASVRAAPAIAIGESGDRLIVADTSGGVLGLRPGDGEVAWRTSVEGGSSLPVVPSGDLAFITTRSGEIVALRAEDGEIVWRVDLGEAPRAAPSINADLIALVDGRGRLLIWSRHDFRFLVGNESARFVGSPLLVGDQIHVANLDGPVDVWNASTFAFEGRWAVPRLPKPDEPPVRVNFGPVLGGDSTWLIDEQGRLWRTGSNEGPTPFMTAWGDQRRVTGAVELQWTVSSPTPSNDHVLIPNRTGSLLAFQARDGEQSVRVHGTEPFVAMLPEPVIADGLVIHARGAKLTATELDSGATRWEISAEQFPPSSLVVQDGNAYWLTRPSEERDALFTLRCIQLLDGTECWRREFRGNLPIVFPGYVSQSRGALIMSRPLKAIDPRDGSTIWESRASLDGIGRPAFTADERHVVLGTVDTERAAVGLSFFDTRDGSERGFIHLGNDVAGVDERVWIMDETVMVPRSSGAVTAFSLATGEQRWHWSGPERRLSAVTLDRGRLWFTTQSGSLLALNALSGGLEGRSSGWEARQEHFLSILPIPHRYTRPVIVDGMIVAPVGIRLLGYRLPEGW